ncbi:ABC transporter ATP-binding protein [Luteitalea sp. TBR-22]|uniref:ABC transporter ATP-binding protein n=1 Tax=Luteitalea sp. TBR-22 TaxID=2802971 RepID=UPI001AF39E88|nr:ABC transporter ATP-binding protein [Luteitalea sp. TBR-22]BCS30846.1 ABC transporter ATP-binding protein [Luteitalea sp. TBR-22]
MNQSLHPAVSCRALRKQYWMGGQPVHALRGIDLEIPERQLVVLSGPSGCGKTTLISIIAGVMDADEGDCLVGGRSWRDARPEERTHRRGVEIGFVFQAFNLIPALTAVENVSLPLLLNGARRRDAEQRAAAMLRRVGLGQRLDNLPRQLSGGQQQRVAIARALVHDPHLVVCDEPTSALDAENGRLVMQLLRDLVTVDGRTLIVVTHDSRVFGFADRIVTLNDGLVVADDTQVSPENQP